MPRLRVSQTATFKHLTSESPTPIDQVRSDQRPRSFVDDGCLELRTPKLELEISRLTSSSSFGRGTWEGDRAEPSWDQMGPTAWGQVGVR